ncbi:hypothetical protein [Paracidobacterium acidisoli]|uniref:Uncharacterized protein n=1 Tax=Paracidobacterium acidisoli TaxID=2303751 RepID=A0A372IRU9_9BACT|nr:hypothetical protein [Paracidobacterium acidisoli]MBT9330508.1 hypothetical protein [Paracidobacterium acidisoli]
MESTDEFHPEDSQSSADRAESGVDIFLRRVVFALILATFICISAAFITAERWLYIPVFVFGYFAWTVFIGSR